MIRALWSALSVSAPTLFFPNRTRQRKYARNWSCCSMVTSWRYFVVLLVPALLAAQQKSDLQLILERLDQVEEENRNLAQEVRLLREELALSRTSAQGAAVPLDQPLTPPRRSVVRESLESAPPPSQPENAAPVEERITVAERRIEEHAQIKVESSQRFPISLTG